MGFIYGIKSKNQGNLPKTYFLTPWAAVCNIGPNRRHLNHSCHLCRHGADASSDPLAVQ